MHRQLQRIKLLELVVIEMYYRCGQCEYSENSIPTLCNFVNYIRKMVKITSLPRDNVYCDKRSLSKRILSLSLVDWHRSNLHFPIVPQEFSRANWIKSFLCLKNESSLKKLSPRFLESLIVQLNARFRIPKWERDSCRPTNCLRGIPALESMQRGNARGERGKRNRC